MESVGAISLNYGISLGKIGIVDDCECLLERSLGGSLALAAHAGVALVLLAEANMHKETSVLWGEDLHHLWAGLIVATFSWLCRRKLIFGDLSLGHASLLSDPVLTVEEDEAVGAVLTVVHYRVGSCIGSINTLVAREVRSGYESNYKCNKRFHY